MKIDPKWLDVDFGMEAERIAEKRNRNPDVEGDDWEGEMLLGCSPTPQLSVDPEAGIKLMPKQEIIPVSEWRNLADMQKGRTLDYLIWLIKDQWREGSCTSNAATQGYQTLLRAALGVCIEFSAMSLYKRVGSGPNSGSGLGENVTELRDRGVLPTDNAENKELFSITFPNVGWSNRLPRDWEDLAINFCIIEFEKITTEEEFGSAIWRGRPVLYGRDGHAILGTRMVYNDGQWRVKYANSWTPDWGDNGFGYDTLSRRLLGYGCYAFRSIKIPEHKYVLAA